MNKKLDVGPLHFIPVRYYIEDRERIKGSIQLGTCFRIMQRKEDGEKIWEQYEVEKKYPYHASCVNRRGARRSFDYFDLDRLLNAG